jgi:hypothetical protein
MSENVTDVTLVHLRRIDQTLQRMFKVLERHDTRLGRIERDIAELKSDQILTENRMLNRVNEIAAWKRTSGG